LKLKNNNISIDKLIAIIKQLRAPDGCDWDKEQTHKTLVPYLLEETYEVIEAIEKNDYNALKEELGDLLLHILFQAELSDEKNKFNIEDSITSICEKLINRHPHIFYDKNNPNYELLKEELGDLLLHVLFQAELANENNKFNIK